MPFTFSHPAITLPLFRSRFVSVSGLVIGSMGPDFEYFLRMDLKGDLGHSLPGLVLFNLPVCLVLCFIFHGIVKGSFVRNLPPFLQKRFRPYLSFNWNHYFRKYWWIVCGCILLGAASHIFWDAFTHRDGYFVINHPGMKFLIPLAGKKYPFYHLLQHASSGIGLIILTVFILKMPPTAARVTSPSRLYWIFVIIFTAVVTMIRLSFMNHEIKIGHVVVVGLSAGMLSLIVAGLLSIGSRIQSGD